ncbi:hypothetical protein CCP3SC5AM1_550012 [Gammaproteobacteria bacterium]
MPDIQKKLVFLADSNDLVYKKCLIKFINLKLMGLVETLFRYDSVGFRETDIFNYKII